MSHATRTNESYHIHEWVKSNTWMSHTKWPRPVGCLKLQVIFRQRATKYRALLRKMTYKDKASHGSSTPCMTHMNDVRYTYEWVMSHIEWVMSHIRMSHVTRMNASCHTYEWVMSHMWMSHVTHMNESCHAYEWVMSHMWMSHVTHMNESCHAYEWVMSHM